VEQFKDPLILLLLGSAVLSIVVGQYEDALSIAAAVIIVGSVAFYQVIIIEMPRWLRLSTLPRFNHLGIYMFGN